MCEDCKLKIKFDCDPSCTGCTQDNKHNPECAFDKKGCTYCKGYEQWHGTLNIKVDIGE